MTALGMTFNNPFDLEYNFSFTWQGQVGRDPHSNLVIFDTLLNGTRAGLIDLRNQQKMHGLNTIRAIITKLSPPTENDTAAYIDDVVAWTGFSADEYLDLGNNQTLIALAEAVTRQETGDPVDMATLQSAIAEV